MLRATDCPVLEVKAKNNVSVPSDVINHQNGSIIAQIDSDFVVHSEATTIFDDITKNQTLNTVLGFLG